MMFPTSAERVALRTVAAILVRLGESSISAMVDMVAEYGEKNFLSREQAKQDAIAKHREEQRIKAEVCTVTPIIPVTAIYRQAANGDPIIVDDDDFADDDTDIFAPKDGGEAGEGS